MTQRQLNLGVLLSSFIGYLEWGQGQSVFLIEAEAEVLRRALREPMSVIHPLTVLPLLGQLALAITLFQRAPSKWLTYGGIAAIGLLLGLMCFVGVIGLNARVLASTLPFLVFSWLAIRRQRR